MLNLGNRKIRANFVAFMYIKVNLTGYMIIKLYWIPTISLVKLVSLIAI